MSFYGLMKKSEYHFRLKELEQELKPAPLRGEEECVMCGYCCIRRSCVPTPDEVVVIAKHLGITVEELVRQYMVSDDGGVDYLYLRFINKKQCGIAGEYLPSGRSWNLDYCIMFDEDTRLCKIHDVKPMEASQSGSACTFAYKGSMVEPRERWKDGDIERLVPNLDLSDGSREEEDEWEGTE